jgi:hypothetical protein
MLKRRTALNTFQGETIMKTRNYLMTAVLLAIALVFGGDAFARGGNGGGGGKGSGGGKGAQVRTHTQSHVRAYGNAPTSQVRPEGSQRRDGTFLETGTTANGSTSRPEHGQGAMDGTGVNAATAVTTTVE